MGKPAFQVLTDFWRASGFDIKFGPNSLAAVSELERKYAIKLPPAFRDYLLYACPRGEDQFDPELTTWWQLDRVKSLEAEYATPRFSQLNPALQRDAGQYLVFVDYIMSCWAWAICCKPGNNYGRIIQLSGQDESVANSFEDFVQFYIHLYGENFFLEPQAPSNRF